MICGLLSKLLDLREGETLRYDRFTTLKDGLIGAVEYFSVAGLDYADSVALRLCLSVEIIRVEPFQKLRRICEAKVELFLLAQVYRLPGIG
ncbi:hypothetical protein WK28_01865 [Burkholderia vietnamiensis]|nr:hypothetical protein WK28_01865 [Burkholderia vietnamiensis]